MKKLSVLLFSLSFLSIYSISQEYTDETDRLFNPIKCEIGGFIGFSKNNDYGFGTGFYLHPSYFINDKLNIGFKGESSVVIKADFDNLASYLGSFQLTSRLYFSTEVIRMYTELGAGLFILNSSDPKKRHLGFSPKFGLDLGPFTTYVSYNYIVESEPYDKNHLTLGAGIFLGGAKRR